MADLELCYTPAGELARLIRERRLSPVEVIGNSLERIEEVNPTLNCFCFVYPEEALERAHDAERAVQAGRELGPLHGVPIAIKDLTPTAGKRTTMGSYAYEDYIPEEDAAVVEKLVGAGAVMVGKTTTPEFAYSSFTESPLWGVTRNPWNLERTPGGSSGGSGAAVASGCVPLAEGSDMGGSVRIPASWSGIVGLKPSFGRIPLDFLPTQFDTIQHLGPLARTIDDARLFVAVAQGPDERDVLSLSPSLDLSKEIDPSAEGLRLALDVDLGHYAIDPGGRGRDPRGGGRARRRRGARRGGRPTLDPRGLRRLGRALGCLPRCDLRRQARRVQGADGSPRRQAHGRRAGHGRGRLQAARVRSYEGMA